MTPRGNTLLMGLLWLSPFSAAQSEVIVIEASQDEAEIHLIREQLDNVAGGTNLIETKQLAGSQSSLAKVLNQQTGIVVQEFFGGNDQPRINIRGSGLQDNPVNRGIQLLSDGLALNQADGSFVIGLIDPEQAKWLSVYRGANAMRYGATTLGGAINFHAKNGLNSRNLAQLELGSYEMYKGNLTLANQKQNWDFLLSTTYSEREGYRNHSAAQRGSLTLNIGYQQKGWQNRTYLTVAENDFEIPFLLTKQRAIESPDQVMGEGSEPMDTLLNIPVRKPFRNTRQLRVANQTHWQTDTTESRFGIYYEALDDQFRNPLTQADTRNRNLGLDASTTLNLVSDDYLTRELLLFLQANSGSMPREFASVHPVTGELMTPFANLELEAHNITLGSQLRYEWIDGFSTIAALQWVLNQREITDTYSAGLLDSSFEYQLLNPKLGLIYQWEQGKRVYANISGSSESPNFWQLATVSANPTDPLNNHVYINELSTQTALTSELGVNWQFNAFSLNASWYYSVVQDELISVVGDFAVNGKTINYQGKTIHHGLETMLTYSIDGLLTSQDALNAKLLYNWSHFYFEDGIYQGNNIAGVPVHLIQGELDYKLAAGWRITPNFTWQPQETYTDHVNNAANTQDPYFLLGLKVGYETTESLRVFLEINNLTNTNYQTAYAIRGQGAPDLPTFIPGPGTNAILGATYSW
ncbi:TonB-dependent receptor family protein [Vibrio sp. TRT 17S01]|uniref:TonB-dependent receptor family protein n=1 Tax=Vibrio sp. TRT 17S01 TaxID=3418505 RepID=UPI003CF0DD2D